MSGGAPFQPVAQLLERGLSVQNVYGAPVTHGNVTVIPIARMTCAFGAGGGAGPGGGLASNDPSRPEIQGAGGGGALRMTPVGALEIGPTGARFIPYLRRGPLLVAGALGLAVGFLLATRDRR